MYITSFFILKINVENFVEKVVGPPFEADKISQNFTCGKILEPTIYLLNYYYTYGDRIYYQERLQHQTFQFG